MNHLTADQLSALADGALDGRAREEAERHLNACASCREALAALTAQDEALVAALSHDPGDAYFESFAMRVGARIRGLEAPARAHERAGGIAAWFRSPRRLTLVGSLAALVAVAGVVFVLQREARVPAMRTEEARRVDQVETKSTQPPEEAPVIVAPEKAEAPPAGSTPAARREALEKQAASGPIADTRAARTGATAGRMMEVRRDPQTGEDVPVNPAPGFARPAPAAAPPMTSEGGVRVDKARVAEPLAASVPREEGGNARVCGVVKTASGRPIEGAQVAITGTSLTATTDASGGFCLAAPVGRQEISVLAAGFKSVTHAVNVGTQTTTAIALEAATPARAAGESRTLALQAPSQRATDAWENLPIYPRSIARNALRLTEIAERLQAASGYDAAAGEWTRLVRHVEGGPLEEETRWQLAVARFRAWQEGSTTRRRTLAVEALRAYIASAPAGTRRDQASTWLQTMRG